MNRTERNIFSKDCPFSFLSYSFSSHLAKPHGFLQPCLLRKAGFKIYAMLFKQSARGAAGVVI